MGTGVTRPSPQGSARSLCCAALGIAAAGLVLLRPSDTLGSRLGVCVFATVTAAVVFAALNRLGRELTGAWLALVLGFGASIAMGTLLGDAAFAAHSWIGAVAAAVGLLATLMLTGSGAAALWRAARPRWRWIGTPVLALVLLQLVAQPMVVGVLASAREPLRATGLTPASRGLEFEDLRLRTSDGVELAAWHVRAEGKAAVVLLHGAGETRSARLAHAEVLHGCGFGVLLLDARGRGDSGGLPMELGWFGEQDVRAGVDALAERYEAIGLVGLSMGGEQALTEAAGDARVRVVVGEGVGLRTAEDVAPGNGLERFVTAIGTGIADVLSSASPPQPLRDAVRQVAPRPVLLIAGTGEERQVEWYRSAAPDEVTVELLPEVPHTGALAHAPDWWRDTVCGALDAALREG